MCVEYNNKIKGLICYNNDTTIRVKELESVLKKSGDDNESLLEGKKVLESENKQIKEKFVLEQEECKTVKEDNQKLVFKVRMLIKMILGLFENGQIVKDDQIYLFETIGQFSGQCLFK
jgi:hypothetical protein